MNIVKNVVLTTRKFVEEHKVGVTAAVTAVVCYKVNRVAITEHDNFLKDKGLYEEFYQPI